jgi:hypothetical protein
VCRGAGHALRAIHKLRGGATMSLALLVVPNFETGFKM